LSIKVSASIQIVRNSAWDFATPQLSVLIPFFRYDPRHLMTSLDLEAAALSGAVEVLVLDDGSGDVNLASSVAAATHAMIAPAGFIRLLRNEGRAKARNGLATYSRARHLLFLDCDMLPDSPSFLATYLRVIEAENPAVVVGGVSVLQAPYRRECALHRQWMQSLDCLPAAARRAVPEKYVFTSNLVVRRDAFVSTSFDENFSGWGWEDIEWAARIVRRWPISHVDNTATHMGLNTPQVLIAQCCESVSNFGRFAAAHPQIVAGYSSYRAARLLRHAPLRRLWRPLLAAVVLTPLVPVSARLLALRLYRATLYAEVV
jgi:glycosyltransferase involved in cell wall biosynthesis